MKKKILAISDHPLQPTGVAYQTRLMIEGLLETGKYQFMSFAGAREHEDYRPQIPEDWKEDWIIIPVDNYGTPDEVRQAVTQWKPDLLWFMTDPRSFYWLFDIEHEIRPKCPMVYYHVWDNYPIPKFNKPFYESCDAIGTISELTDDIVKTLSPSVKSKFIPHGIESHFYKPLETEEKKRRREETFGEHGEKMLLFWNNKNFRRKLPGTLLKYFKDFCDEYGEDKVSLVMHTKTQAAEGQNLRGIVEDLGLKKGQVFFHEDFLTEEQLGEFYALCDVGINIADAEGWGLSVTESLFSGLPVIATKTGGMQGQLKDGDNVLGVLLEPDAQALIGSQTVPYIHEDRVSSEKVTKAIKEMLDLWYNKEEFNKLSKRCREVALERYDSKKYQQEWIDFIEEVIQENGSWETRKNYKNFRVKVL